MIKPFTTYVATLASLTVGTNLFAGWRPATAPDLCTVILEQVSAQVDPDNKRMREKPVQLLTRGPSYFTARNEAFRVFDLIINITNITITGWLIHSITGGEPQSIGQDKEGRYEFSTNVIVRLKEAA